MIFLGMFCWYYETSGNIEATADVSANKYDKKLHCSMLDDLENKNENIPNGYFR